MPTDTDAQDLTHDQVMEISELLRALREDLQGQLEQAKNEARPVDLELPIGRITRVDALQQQQMSSARRTRLENRLSLVLAAERRIAAGEYGECAGCELPIGYARLKASPEVLFCTRCQSAR